MDNVPITVLLIGADAKFGKSVSDMITTGFVYEANVVVALTLASALEYIQNQPATMVLLDLALPDARGFDAIEEVKACSDKVPIVLLTGPEDDKLSVEALKLGAQDYLLKSDISPEQLGRTIAHAIERKRLQVLEAERLKFYEQREDFMVTLTHDMKNPLLGANRVLEILADPVTRLVSEEIREMLLLVRDSNQAVIAMIGSLAESYRYERGFGSLILENTNLALLIRTYLNNLQRINSGKVTLKSEIEDNLDPVLVDRNAIMRVVQNLLDNAVKFSPAGGVITVKLWQESAKAFFEVCDQGPGIPSEDRMRLFQRFSQGRSGRLHSTGTGLGLFLCRQIVEAHNGLIWCQSSEQSGATFTVSLPLP
jgi:signal transduction histidine kinase